MIYLDNASTTKPLSEVVKAMIKIQKTNYGNASSIHKFGISASKDIEKARNIIAKSINASPDEIFFTSGGTESNNFAIKGIVYANKNKSKHLLISRIEHPSILNPSMLVNENGVSITYLSVNNIGRIDLSKLEKSIRKDTILVSIMHANNEIGTIQDIKKIGQICKRKKVYFHTDACQSFTKVEINTKTQNLDLVTLNGHKIHGPKGVGVLYIKKGIKIIPFMHGGNQEMSIRSGTYNTAGIVGMGVAVQLANKKDITNMIKLRDYFINKIMKKANVSLNGSIKERLCNNINLIFHDIDGKKLFMELSKRGIYVSRGSACSSGKTSPSQTLISLGLSPELVQKSIRFSISKFTTLKEIDFVIENLSEIIKNEKL